MDAERLPTKVGAGLLICCEGSCLLLQRSETSGNPGTWGLPGGNADAQDGGDLQATAVREAKEEIGDLPPGMQVLGSVLTRRGKNLQKHYTVFVASIPGASRAHYQPTLNDEHTDWRWLDLRHAATLAAGPAASLHRRSAGHPHGHGAAAAGGAAAAIEEQEAAAIEEEGAAAAAGPPPSDVQLHPVVRVLFGGAHADALGAMLPRGAAPSAAQG